MGTEEQGEWGRERLGRRTSLKGGEEDYNKESTEGVVPDIAAALPFCTASAILCLRKGKDL